MESGLILVYILKASIYLLLFFAFNKWLLGRETLHKLNRVLWLAITFLSFALPLVDGVKLFEGEAEYLTTTNLVSLPIAVAQESAAQEVSILPMVVNAIFIIYLIGVAALLLYNIWVHCSLFRFIFSKKYNIRYSTSEVDRSLKGQFLKCETALGIEMRSIEYIIHDKNVAPFSWMNYVVISREDLVEMSREIVVHELSHVKQRHSWDILLINLVTIVMWFNPAAWLTKRSLQQVHEYCADESVVEQGVNIKEYQLLLIKKAVGARLYSISNSLNHSNLKNRITMMLQKKSNKVVAAKCLYTIPLALGVLSLFASPAFAESVDEVLDVKITKKIDDSKLVTTEISELTTPNEEKDSKSKMTIDKSNVVYIVDGKVSKNKLGALSAEHIKSIDVVKDKSRNSEFGVDPDANLVMVTLREGVDPELVNAAAKYQEKYDFATVLKDGMIIQKIRGKDNVTYVCPDGRNGDYPKEKLVYMLDGTVYKELPELEVGETYAMDIHVSSTEGDEFPRINVLITNE